MKEGIGRSECDSVAACADCFPRRMQQVRSADDAIIAIDLHSVYS